MRVTVGAALCVLTVSSARADVDVRPGVPFTAPQLEAAIAARVGAGRGDVDIEVSSLGPDRLTLVTPDGTWEIEIGTAGSDTAARVVALYVIELARSSQVVAPADATTIATEVPASAGARPTYRLAVLGVVARGPRTDDLTMMGGAIELTGANERLVAGGGISWQHGLTIDSELGDPISAELVRARVVGGVALGPLELVAGGFAGRIIVDGGPGVLGRWSTGLAAEARAALAVSPGWAVEIAAGAELFRDRIEVRFGDDRIGATPRMTLGGRIGLAWTRERSR
jgi:hypothetical protein